MKTMILTVILLLIAGPAFGQDADHGFALHMRKIHYNFRQARVEAQSDHTYYWAATRVRDLRAHAIQAIALMPDKVKAMKRFEQQRAMLEYHQLLSRLIYMAASLEDAFTAGDDYESISVSRELDIQNLFHEIEKLMNYAHQKFR